MFITLIIHCKTQNPCRQIKIKKIISEKTIAVKPTLEKPHHETVSSFKRKRKSRGTSVSFPHINYQLLLLEFSHPDFIPGPIQDFYLSSLYDICRKRGPPTC